jgi:hypothetical protein
MRNDLNLLMDKAGEKRPNGIRESIDAWESLFPSKSSTEWNDSRQILEEAEKLRNEIVDDPGGEPTSARVRTLSKGLNQVHDLIELECGITNARWPGRQ